MNKKELVEKVAERTAMTKKDTELVINALTDCIRKLSQQEARCR